MYLASFTDNYASAFDYRYFAFEPVFSDFLLSHGHVMTVRHFVFIFCHSQRILKMMPK